MNTPKTAAQILLDAKALLEKGWTQGVYYEKKDNQDCYCIYGAIGKACGVSFKSGDTGDAGIECAPSQQAKDAIEAIEAVLPNGFYFIDSYNDRPCVTQDDVLGLMDKAIETTRTFTRFTKEDPNPKG